VAGSQGDSQHIVPTEGSQVNPKKGETILELGFNDNGAVKADSLFYQPQISKPIRAKRNVTIRLNKNGVLEGIPTAWRQVLEMPP
jgi:hypothetical protein